MISFLKRRRQERMKKEVIEVGTAVMEAVNQTVEQWREALSLRADLVLASFDERIVVLCPEGDLTLTEVQEIEVLAMMKNAWIDDREERLSEARELLGELWAYVDELGVRSEVEAFIAETYDQAGRDLAASALIAADQEAARRGETRGRSLFD